MRKTVHNIKTIAFFTSVSVSREKEVMIIARLGYCLNDCHLVIRSSSK